MRCIDTHKKFDRRQRPEETLAVCRNQIDSLQNLNYLASLDAIAGSPQLLHLGMMERYLHLLADTLFLPA